MRKIFKLTQHVNIKGEIIEKSLKVYFAANPHFLWKHFVFDDFGITRGISKWCKHNFLDLSNLFDIVVNWVS